MAVELEMTLKDAQVLMGLLKMAREQDKVTKSVKGTQEAFKDTAKEIDRTAAAAKTLIATPIERLKQKEDQLNAAFKAGKLTVDEKNRALTVYRERIMGAERESQKLNMANQGTFGPTALESIKSYAAGVLGITAVVSKLAEGIEKVNQLKLAGMEGLKGEYEHLVSLNQLSTSPEEFAARKGTFDELRSKYGLTTAQAAELQEVAIAAGNEGTMSRFAGTPGAGPAAERMRYASKLEALSGGQIDEVMADAMIKAAADPSMVTPAELAKYTPSAGAMMQAQGATPAEVLGAMSVLSDTLKGPEAAADRLANLQTQMSLDPRLRGKGLIGGVEELQGMSEEERREFLGKSEGLNIAYEQITQNRQLIDQRIRSVREAGAAVGTERDPILASQRQFESSAEAMAVRENQIATQQADEALREGLGSQAIAMETGRKRLRARFADRPQVAVAVDEAAHRTEQFGGTIAAAATGGLVGDSQVIAALLKLIGLQTEQVQATKAVDQNTKQRGRPPAATTNPR